MITNNHIQFLYLVRLGIGHHADEAISGEVDWTEIKTLAEKQGLTAIVLDGLDAVNGEGFKVNGLGSQCSKSEENLNQNLSDSKLSTLNTQLKLEWIGEVLQNYEQRYKAYEKAISSLAGFYNSHGYKMMVLKGYACSSDWPRPEHRPCGDIDIWVFGEQEKADEFIRKEKGIKVDTSHHHHTTFDWEGFLVENHYDFVNTKDLKSSKSMELIFKELGQDESHYMEVAGEKVYLPSPNLHALFLIRHLALHFASVSINLRQLLDWAFFVEKHTDDINWAWLVETLEKYHMLDFYNCINAICVGDLGFSVRIFPNVQFDPSLKDKMVKDILEPEFVAEEPKHFFPRLIYKYQRWQGNAWKQNLCFGESRRAFFWRSLWAHLLKPASL